MFVSAWAHVLGRGCDEPSPLQKGRVQGLGFSGFSQGTVKDFTRAVLRLSMRILTLRREELVGLVVLSWLNHVRTMREYHGQPCRPTKLGKII